MVVSPLKNRSPVKIHLLLGILLLLTFFVGCTTPSRETVSKHEVEDPRTAFRLIRSEYEKGKKEARWELLKGNVYVQMPGVMPSEFTDTVIDFAKNKYQVELIFGGCIASDESLSFDKGFDEIMTPALDNRFGEDFQSRFFQEAYAISEKLYFESRKIKKPKNPNTRSP